MTVFCWSFKNTEHEKMHSKNNIKFTHQRFEVHTTVELHFHTFCHVTPCHQVSNSQHLQGSRSLKSHMASIVGWNSASWWIFQSCQERVTVI